MSRHAPACPVCGKPVTADFRPFCSRRCADVDLARWLRGDYRLPGRDGEALEEHPRPDLDEERDQ